MTVSLAVKSAARDAARTFWRVAPLRTVRNQLPDRMLISLLYYKSFGKVLRLSHPQTFNEKLQWLKLNYRKPVLTQLADKYSSRFLVAARLGEKVLNEIYGVWDRAAEINFARLPESFVLKVTTASAANIFCRDKTSLDMVQTRATLSNLMRRNHYLGAREWPYRNIKPRIIAERFMLDECGRNPQDFKFFCFDGEPRFIQVDTSHGGVHARNFYTMEFAPAPFTIGPYPASPKPIFRPSNLAEMALCASSLSRGFPFTRVDFYSFKGRTVFGEVDWYPDAGLHVFHPESYDEELGKMIELPPLPSDG
jgi:hypothetical protein